MAIKYHCKKCERRFIDWGAEKLDFKCPDCEGEELVRTSLANGKPAKKPSLKRRPKKKRAAKKKTKAKASAAKKPAVAEDKPAKPARKKKAAKKKTK